MLDPHLYTLVFWQIGRFRDLYFPDKRNAFFINSNPHPPIIVKQALEKRRGRVKYECGLDRTSNLQLRERLFSGSASATIVPDCGIFQLFG